MAAFIVINDEPMIMCLSDQKEIQVHSSSWIGQIAAGLPGLCMLVTWVVDTDRILLS
jgi:hypothetical protein